MPSIRIRNSAYSTLRDSPVTPSATQSRPLALTTLFSPPNEDQNLTASPTAAGPPAPPRMQRSMPAMRDVLTESSPPITRQGRQTARNTRPRSNTTESRSRVSSFVTGSQGRRYPTTKGTPASDVQSLLRQPDYQPSPTTPATDYGRTPATLGSDRNQVRDRSPSARFSVRPPSDKDSSTDSSSDDAWTHHDDVVEHLDVIDPQVATVSSLTNAANNLLFPPLPYYSRRPVLVLQPLMTQVDPSHGDLEVGEEMHLDDTLDRHVDDVIKRPSPIRRTLMGVWSFVKTPMGFITAVYGFCVVFWGAAIVLFAGKLINLHNPSTQGFWVEVSSQIENGLFTATGIGLIPFRAFDTYRIYWIWHYKRKTKRLRAERGLPQLLDVDDLPDPKYDPNYVHVLTEKEEHDLYRQQRKFQHSQTWYRPHGTETHRAFPINTALLICLLSDGNSFFQILLCGCMWGLDRYTRPAWTTGTLIPCSFVCGILAGVFIWRGDKQTKRVEAVKERLQAALNTSLEQSPHDNSDNAHTSSRIHEKIHEAEEPSEEPSENEQESEGSNAPHLAVDEHMTIPTVLEKDGHGAKNGN